MAGETCVRRMRPSCMRHILVTAIAALPLCLAASKARANIDPRILYLEQEVRDLKRQVMALTQRLDQATTRPPRVPAPNPSGSFATVPAAEAKWLDAEKWESLRAGMSELEVVELLGKPNSTREDSGLRVALYAMEIGDSGFLGGSVRFRDGKVVEIQRPRLQ